MKLSRLTLLVFLSQVSGFRDLLFEELEPLLSVLEVRELPEGDSPAFESGHSLLYSGQLTTQDTDFRPGDLLLHPQDNQDCPTAQESSVLIYFPAAGMEQLLRAEPELGMLLLEHLRAQEGEAN